jgi:transcription factor SFP1
MFNTKIFDSSSATTPSINIQQDDNLANSQPIDITYQRHHSIFNNSRFRRESIAHSQGMGGVSWGSVTIGSWLKDEVMMMSSSNNAHNNHGNAHNLSHGVNHTQSINLQPNFSNQLRRSSFKQNPSISISPPQHTSYLPNLESEYCKDYSCCGELLPTLHDLLRHYEEAHISPSPPAENHHQIIDQNRNRNLNMHNMLETVSTTDVFLNNTNNQHFNASGNPQQFNTQHIQQVHQQLAQQHANTFQQPQSNFNNQQGVNANFNNHQQQQNQFNQQSHQQQMMHPNNFQTNTNSNHNSIPTSIQPQQLPIHPQIQQTQQQTINPSRASNQIQNDEEDSMYIDDPARHLYVMENDEHKPFKCPVIGCEKTYKNQNGLKYHRLHGHQNQKLKENPDGTISIIDPESNTPYLDGAGMEKDKPYRCEVCGKRYKNLNGLKYHRGHTTH